MDDEDVCVPPTVEQVRARALAMAHYLARFRYVPPPDVIEEVRRESTEEEWNDLVQGVTESTQYFCDSLKSRGLWSVLTPKEQELIAMDFLHMPDQGYVNAGWLIESFDVLIWALGLQESLPPFDTLSVEFDLAEKVVDGEVDVSRAILRSAADIEHARDMAEAWHWRSRTRELQEEDRAITLPPGETFDLIVRSVALGLQSDGEFVAIVEDFPALGVAYRELSGEQQREVRSISMERQHALNWLCGYAPENKWEETPTDT